MRNWSVAGSIDPTSEIYLGLFKLLNLTFSCENIGDAFLDTTGTKVTGITRPGSCPRKI
jgi:hypothetical protein